MKILIFVYEVCTFPDFKHLHWLGLYIVSFSVAKKPITAAKNQITAATNPITAAKNPTTAAKNTTTAAIILYRSFLPTSGCY